MAKSSNATAVIISLVMMLSLLLITFSPVAESRFLGVGMVKEEAGGILCDLVHGVESGETCSGVVEKFKLNAETFTLINPNLNCDALFVGQWVCIDGAPN